MINIVFFSRIKQRISYIKFDKFLCLETIEKTFDLSSGSILDQFERLQEEQNTKEISDTEISFEFLESMGGLFMKVDDFTGERIVFNLVSSHHIFKSSFELFKV